MEEGALLRGMSSPEEAMVPDLFSADGGFVSENMPLKAAAVGRAEEEEFHVLKDPYLSDRKGPLLHAFNPPLSGDCKTKAKAEFLAEENEEEMLGEFPRLPELDALEDAVLPAVPPPQAYNVHFLSPVRTPHGSPAVVPLGAWAREGAAHAGVRVIPVEVKEGGGTSEVPEEAALQNTLSQDARMFRSSQEVEGASGVSHQDASPMVICQLRGAAPMLCIDSSGAGELKALHWAPQGQDQNDSPQSDGPRAVTAVVGRLLPVPAKLSLITQPLGDGASLSTVNGSAFPAGPALAGPPRIAVAGCCDGFAGGDFCNNCRCSYCCSDSCHGIDRFKAIKAKVTCPSVCKCVGCRNYQESPERKTLVAVPTRVETGGAEGGRPRLRAERCVPGRRSSCISWEVVEATCACLLAQGEEAERAQRPEGLAQQMILEEFGRCLSQILHTEFKSKGLTME